MTKSKLLYWKRSQILLHRCLLACGIGILPLLTLAPAALGEQDDVRLSSQPLTVHFASSVEGTPQPTKLSAEEWNILGEKLLRDLSPPPVELLRTGPFRGPPPNITVFNNPLPIASYSKREGLLFSSGILNLVENTDEFAFLIAHELSHEYLGHLSQPSGHWTFQEEAEADAVAIQLLRRAGYLKNQGPELLERLADFGSEHGFRLGELYPNLTQRSEHLRKTRGTAPIHHQ
ncbi:M48 family metallopeptidase [bacterium]|nr:M48 family metallopeptidase [bacterium]